VKIQTLPDRIRVTETNADDAHIAWDTGEARVAAEGHPVGCQWVVNGQPMIFRDGFETGSAGRWE
jgi:hypothetical protein